MPVAEVRKRFDRIVEFSGLADFIDAPVKTYLPECSSGSASRSRRTSMRTSCSLDEVLAVGDIAFQAHCMDRIEEIRRSGRTIILISHDLAAVERIRDRALLLTSGEVVDEGPPEVIESFQIRAAAHAPCSSSNIDGGGVALNGVSFISRDGGRPRTGDSLTVHVSYKAEFSVVDAVFTVSFVWPSGYPCTELVSTSSLLVAGGF